MGKKVYLGVSGKARKVKKMYIGVSSKARKVKKGYIGVGGKARLFFTGGEVAYYGTATPLSVGRMSLAGDIIGNYALFAGGQTINDIVPTVDAYNQSLVRSIPSPLGGWRIALAHGHNPSYALFGGGKAGSYSYTNVWAYNTSLTRSTAPDVHSDNIPVGGSIGNYVLFAGGLSAYVSAYNTSLTKSFATNLSVSNSGAGSSPLGTQYVLFACGRRSDIGTLEAIANAYNASLTRTILTPPDVKQVDPAGAAVGNYALFAGSTATNSSSDATAAYNKIQVYNTSLTKLNALTLSGNRQNIAGTSLPGYAVFAGGYTGSAVSNMTFLVDESLTITNGPGLSVARSGLSGVTNGNYALFAGGSTTNLYGGSVNTVDVFMVD